MSGVSVLIPTWNRAGFLEGAIQSVLDQTHRPLEIVISDNCSSDDTPSLVQRYAAEEREGVTIRSFRQARNIGHVENHAFVLQQASCRYCCFLHDDDFFSDPSFLADAVANLEGTPDCFLCVGNSVIRPADPAAGATPDRVMMQLPGRRDGGWQVLDGTDFAFGLGVKTRWPSYSAIVFDREETRRSGAFKPPHLIGESESRRYGFCQTDGLTWVYLLAVGRKVFYKSDPVAVRLAHPGQIIHDPLVIATSPAGSLLLRSSLFTQLLRERRVSPLRLAWWFLTMIWNHGKHANNLPVLWQLFRLRPGVTLLYVLVLVTRWFIGRVWIRPYRMVWKLVRPIRQVIRRQHGPSGIR